MLVPAAPGQRRAGLPPPRPGPPRQPPHPPGGAGGLRGPPPPPAPAPRGGTREPGYRLDDQDHFANRRIRSVGELIQNQVRIGLSRMERVVRERMTTQDVEA